MRVVVRSAFAIATVLAAACHQPTHIEVVPTQPVLRTRTESAQLIARVMFNNVEDTRARAVWTVSDPELATVDALGRVRGLKGGRVTVTATYGKLTSVVPVELQFVESLRSDVEAVELSRDAGDPVKPRIEVVGYDGRPMKDRVPLLLSKDSRICNVDARGQIWPVERGETTVTASLDDQKVTIQCTVK